MLFHEAVRRRASGRSTQDPRDRRPPASLELASAGIYGEHQLANVTPERLERFFTRRSSGYQISQDLRQLIVFARHNVTKDAPFTKMHFISCRNMLIYLQPQAQRTVLSLFHFGLAPAACCSSARARRPARCRRVHVDRRALEDLPQAARRPRCSRQVAAADRAQPDAAPPRARSAARARTPIR